MTRSDVRHCQPRAGATHKKTLSHPGDAGAATVCRPSPPARPLKSRIATTKFATASWGQSPNRSAGRAWPACALLLCAVVSSPLSGAEFQGQVTLDPGLEVSFYEAGLSEPGFEVNVRGQEASEEGLYSSAISLMSPLALRALDKVREDGGEVLEVRFRAGGSNQEYLWAAMDGALNRGYAQLEPIEARVKETRLFWRSKPRDHDVSAWATLVISDVPYALQPLGAATGAGGANADQTELVWARLDLPASVYALVSVARDAWLDTPGNNQPSCDNKDYWNKNLGCAAFKWTQWRKDNVRLLVGATQDEALQVSLEDGLVVRTTPPQEIGARPDEGWQPWDALQLELFGLPLNGKARRPLLVLELTAGEPPAVQPSPVASLPAGEGAGQVLPEQTEVVSEGTPFLRHPLLWGVVVIAFLGVGGLLAWRQRGRGLGRKGADVRRRTSPSLPRERDGRSRDVSGDNALGPRTASNHVQKPAPAEVGTVDGQAGPSPPSPSNEEGELEERHVWLAEAQPDDRRFELPTEKKIKTGEVTGVLVFEEELRQARRELQMYVDDKGIEPSSTPEWCRLVSRLEVLGANGAEDLPLRLMDVLGKASELDDTLRLLTVLAVRLRDGRAIRGVRQTETTWFASVAPGERAFLYKIESECRAMRFGYLVALTRVRCHLQGQPLESPIASRELDALRKLFVWDEAHERLDVDLFKSVLINRIIIPTISHSLYLTHSGLVERCGDSKEGLEAGRDLLASIKDDIALDVPSMTGSWVPSAPGELLELMGWRAERHFPYITEVREIVARANALELKVNLERVRASELGDGAGLSRLVEPDRIARVDVPMLYDASHLKHTAPSYRVLIPANSG